MRAALTWSPTGKGNQHGTALWDNIDAAFRMLGAPRQGDVIVVVSDGRDNRSRLHEEDVRSELLRAGVPVIAMMLGYPLAGGLEESAGVLDLLDLAKETGGSVMMVGTVVGPRNCA